MLVVSSVSNAAITIRCNYGDIMHTKFEVNRIGEYWICRILVRILVNTIKKYTLVCHDF